MLKNKINNFNRSKKECIEMFISTDTHSTECNYKRNSMKMKINSIKNIIFNETYKNITMYIQLIDQI